MEINQWHQYLTTIDKLIAPPRRPPKSNRQRCREFRERKKLREQFLENRVKELRTQVSQLVQRKALYTSTLLQRRHTAFGSLENLTRQYFVFFRCGIVETKLQFQREFLERLIEPNPQFSPEASFTEWKYYTAAVTPSVLDVQRIETLGTEDVAILRCHTVCTYVMTRRTFQFLFPHILSNEALVQRYIGLNITLPITIEFQFSPNGKILTQSTEVNLCEALVAAGCRMNDIAELLGHFYTVDDYQAASEYMRRLSLESNESNEVEYLSNGEDKTSRLSIAYLLESNDPNQVDYSSNDEDHGNICMVDDNQVAHEYMQRFEMKAKEPNQVEYSSNDDDQGDFCMFDDNQVAHEYMQQPDLKSKESNEVDCNDENQSASRFSVSYILN